MSKEKFWWIVDNKRGDDFFTKLNVSTKAEAIAKAKSEWESLAANDREKRAWFGVVFAEEYDNDGCPNYDTETDSFDIVDRRSQQPRP